jgi:hypothetical protein
MRTKYLGVCGVMGGVAMAALGGAVACGTSFDAADCKTSRICVDAGGQSSGDGGAAAQGNNNGGAPDTSGGTSPTGGTPANGGTSTNGEPGGAGAANLGGAGGTPDTGCHGPADCTDGDPVNGEEICDPDGTCSPGNPPPTVTDVSPADKTKNVDPEGNIVITFSEALAPSTVTTENIQVLAGDTAIAGKLTPEGDKVTFTPDVPLYLLEPFKISVSTAVTDVDGAALLSPFESTFTTRDGAWTTAVNGATGSLTDLSDTLPISATGNTLLAWGVVTGAGCPATAAWFRHGTPNGAAKPFDTTDKDCQGVTAGGNAAGVAAVAWSVPNLAAGVLANQFRSGVWQAKNAIVSSSTNYGMFRAAVSPTGIVTVIGQNAAGGSTAWRTDAAGKWADQFDALSPDKALSPASVAFNAKGDGMAVWSAQNSGGVAEILFSQFENAKGTWGTAAVIPDGYPAANAGTVDHAPGIAFSDDGDAVAVWIQSLGEPGEQINTSVYSHVTNKWAAVTKPLMLHLSDTSDDAPSVAYDGQAFVTAWVGKPINAAAGLCGTEICTFTDRYDVKAAKWGTVATQQVQSPDLAAAKTPRLASDGRGNVMLVWAQPSAVNVYTLVYQRYQAGKWSDIAVLPGGSVTDPNFAHPLALSMNASGMAAVSWGNYNNGIAYAFRVTNFY